MTVNLSTARAGCEVTFRSGWKAVIAERIGSGYPVIFTFKDYPDGATYSYSATGSHAGVRSGLLDIVSITDPQAADRLYRTEVADK